MTNWGRSPRIARQWEGSIVDKIDGQQTTITIVSKRQQKQQSWEIHINKARKFDHIIQQSLTKKNTFQPTKAETVMPTSDDNKWLLMIDLIVGDNNQQYKGCAMKIRSPVFFFIGNTGEKCEQVMGCSPKQWASTPNRSQVFHGGLTLGPSFHFGWPSFHSGW